MARKLRQGAWCSGAATNSMHLQGLHTQSDLQALLDHVEGGHARVAGDCGKHAGRCDCKRVVTLLAAAQRLLCCLIRCKVQCMRWPA